MAQGARRCTTPADLPQLTAFRGISRKRLDALTQQGATLEEAAGIPPDLRHFPALKHSCGVHLLLQGLGGVDQVKDWLGHRNIQMMAYLQ